MSYIVLTLIISIFLLSCSFIKIEFSEEHECEMPSNIVIPAPDIIYSEISDSLQGNIIGIIIDENDERVPFASVVLGRTQIGAMSDEKGEFIINNINPGFYNIIIQHMGYKTLKIKNMEIKRGKSANLGSISLQADSRNIKGFIVDKPIIYLYPRKETKIRIKLDYDGELLNTYPKYNDGWNVKAYPDGTIIDKKGKEYYALYWEGKPNKKFNVKEGFVIPGDKTIEFLEVTLEELGLNRKEANEFIIYWLPKMEYNPYNLIHFSSTEYDEMAKLNITPKPDAIIRIMMVVKKLNCKIYIKEQNISSLRKVRKGFTVVEWGGCMMPQQNL